MNKPNKRSIYNNSSINFYPEKEGVFEQFVDIEKSTLEKVPKQYSKLLLCKSLLFVFLLMLCSLSSVQAQSSTVGTTGAQFLKIGSGARAEAMKGAYVGLTNDANSVFWNPAGLAGVKGTSVTFSTIEWWAGIDVNQLGFATSLGSLGTLGISLMNVSVPEQEITTVEEPDGTGRFFDANDLMIGASYSRFLTNDFSFGITAKYVRQQLWNETASGISFDVGTQYQFGFKDLILGMSVTNFGGDMQLDGQDLNTIADRDDQDFISRRPRQKLETIAYPIPLNFQVGLSGKPISTPSVDWILTTDIHNPNDNNEMISFGTEWVFKTSIAQIAGRGGYMLNNPDETWALGAGTLIQLTGVRARIDYSYSEHKFLSAIQRISFSLDF